jgi:hypothetical protein
MASSGSPAAAERMFSAARNVIMPENDTRYPRSIALFPYAASSVKEWNTPRARAHAGAAEQGQHLRAALPVLKEQRQVEPPRASAIHSSTSICLSRGEWS